MMSLSVPKTEPLEDDKISLLSIEVDADADASKEARKPSFTFQEQHLNVPHGDPILRVPSPDAFSELSYDAYGRPGRRSISLGQYDTSLNPPRGFKAKTRAFWIRNKGLGLVLLAQIFGTLMNVTTRLLEIEGNNGKGLHPFQILFARMGITVILASAWMWYKKTPDFPLGAKEVRWLLVARGIGGFFGVYGMYYSLIYLPLADATVITFLAPGIACWACSYILKEPFTKMEQVAAFISLFGVVLIARPMSLFQRGSDHTPPASGGADPGISHPNSTTAITEDKFSFDNVTPQQRTMAVGMAMIGVFGAVVAFTTIRWIGKRAHALLTVNYFAVWCTIVSIVMMFILPGVGFLLPANLKEWLYLIFLGTCGFIMQFLLAAGLQYEKSSRATNMVYTQMLFALAFDKLVFGTTPGILSIIGSSLILGSAIYVAIQKEAAKSKEPMEMNSSIRNADEEQGLVDGMDADDVDERTPVQEVQLRTLRV